MVEAALAQTLVKMALMVVLGGAAAAIAITRKARKQLQVVQATHLALRQVKAITVVEEVTEMTIKTKPAGVVVVPVVPGHLFPRLTVESMEVPVGLVLVHQFLAHL